MPRSDHVADLLAALAVCGGTATRRDLVAASSDAAIRKALATGAIRRVGRGRYSETSTLPRCERPWATWATAAPDPTWVAARRSDLAYARAHDVCLSHRSAALAWEWPVLVLPEHVEMTADTHRRRPPVPVMGRRALSRDERADGVTSPLMTVMDCARTLPLVEAVAIADGALRSGLVGATEMNAMADRPHRRDASDIRRVVALADARSANPFESAVRAVASTVTEVHLEPQVDLGGDGLRARVDLADRALRLVIEADSFAYHGDRNAFDRDIDRYNELASRGWTVIRARWAHIGTHQKQFRALLRAAALTARSRSAVQTGRGSALDARDQPDRRRAPRAGLV